MTGRFIVFEGGEATGKSTQARLLADRLGALLTHEPGGTALGAAIRSIVLDNERDDLDHRAEALLIAADKAQHVTEVIRPALDKGVDVICDRYTASAIAYQGYGRGIDRAVLESLLRFATGGLEPDLTVLLEVPAHFADERLGRRRDRFESESAEFHRRVHDGFRALAATAPDRWAVLDGSGTVDEVAALVHDAVARRFGT
jgi:dTMP kinase